MKLSSLVPVTPMEIKQDGEFTSLGTIEQGQEKQLSYLESLKYLSDNKINSNISCLITKPELIPSLKIIHPIGLAISSNPKKTFFTIHNFLAKQRNFYTKNFEREIGLNTIIHPTAYVADTNISIGDNCVIGPNVSILEDTIIQNNVIIRVGTVVGTEGFEFKRFQEGILPVVHAGGVIIHDNVEIQANCCISKGVFGDNTEIGDNTKLDNLVHVAHGVKIGKRCMIAASAMIAGSATIGDDVWIGPGSSISNQITIGDNASITIGSVVTKNVNPGQKVTGNFAIDHEKYISFLKTIR